MRHPAVVALVVVASLLVAVALISFWATIDILNADRFAEHATAALYDETAREAIASGMVETVLKDRPIALGLLHDRLVEFIAPLMGHPMFQQVVTDAITQVHDLLLTGTDRPVELRFGALKPIVTALVTAIDPELGADVSESMSSVAENVQLFREEELPHIRRIAQIVPWLWPLAALGAAICYGVATSKAVDRRRAVAWIAYGLVAAGGALLVFVPSLQSAIVTGITRPAARALTDAALTSLFNDLQLLAVLTAGSGGVVWLISRSVGDAPSQAATAPASADTPAA